MHGNNMQNYLEKKLKILILYYIYLYYKNFIIKKIIKCTVYYTIIYI